MRPFALAVLLAVGLSLPAFAAEPEGPSTLITQAEGVRIALQGVLAAKTSGRKSEREALIDYYSVPEQKLLWVDEHGINDRGKAIMAEIGKADDWGLRASDYPLPKADAFRPGDPKEAEWLANAEVKISYAVLDYANDARGGRIDPQRLDKNLDPTLTLPDPSEVLGSIAIRSDPAAYLRSFQPDQPQFEALRQKLLALRGGKTEEEPEPGVLPIPDGPVLKLGVKDEQVALLRKRLDVPAQPGADEMLFDKDLLQAVRKFQAEHGAAPDGVVGAGTRSMLNNPSAPRQTANSGDVDLILANMERWRWLPHDLGAFYIQVNLPEFMLRVVEDGKVIHTTRIVAGKPDKQTPVFSNEMKEIVFNPNWYVPNSIKVEEIAPYLQQGGGFFGGGWDTSVLRRHNLHIRGYNGRDIDPDTIDWGNVDIRRYELYQPPGPDNVLGKVKFLFPNKHDVYMHDTTQKNLFAQTVRAESHGCMRVQYPDQLAALILKRDQGWNQSRLDSAFANTQDDHVALKQKIPVYISYFTLWVNDDGSMSQFRDLYGHDSRMIAALTGKGYVYDQDDSQVVADQWDAPPPVQTRQRVRRRNSLDNDFARALFGF